MLTIEPISSLFDFLTFFLLNRLLRADEALFHTGWFVESIASQVLVVFVIRTRRMPLESRPHPALAALAALVVVAAAALPFVPGASALGFVPMPFELYAVLATTVLLYLIAMEAAKRMLHAKFALRFARAA
ncbi:MAG: cation transporting ATPase C-terminal domain-containing protein, partial [Burkholderiales bacterium]